MTVEVKKKRKKIPFRLMTHASESCAMLIPLALAIFSTLFFYQSYISLAFEAKKKKTTTYVLMIFSVPGFLP